MKKSICLAIVGAAVLSGCQNEVMQQREYVPAPREDAEAVSTAVPGENAVSDRSSTGEIADERGTATAERPAAARNEQEFPTMSGNFGNEGISSDAGAPAARGGEYVVRPGDTLGKIAAAHNVSLTALMKANNLTNKDAKKLRVGRKLVIPSGRDAAVSGKGKGKGKGGRKGSFGGAQEATGRGAKRAAKAEIQPGEYVIKSGDTPEKIARRAGVKLSALMEANHMTEEAARRLQVGQKIVIPGKGQTATAAKPAAQKTAAKPAAPKTGEAAAPKSAQTGAGSDDIEREMDDAKVTPQGTPAPAATPAAPAPQAAPAAPAAGATTPEAVAPEAERTSYVQVQEDTTIEAFAAKYGTTPEVIRQLNPDITGNRLTKDRIYEVPKK